MVCCTAPCSILLLLFIINTTLTITVQAGDVAGYLFLHFYDNKEQVYGSLSNGNNALAQTIMLKKGAPLLTSNVGTGGVRDHFIVSKPDQSQHWILATDLNRRKAGGYNNPFESRSIVVWASKGASLTQWNPPHLLELVPPNFRQAWAPEAIYDEHDGTFILYWSSQEYSDKWHVGKPSPNKIYIAHTRDFTTLLTQPHVYYAREDGTSVIDMTIKRTGWNEYVRFYKDENAMRCTGQVSGNTFWGPWYDISPGEFVDNNGPGEACLILHNDWNNKWYVLTDQYYRKPPGYHTYYAPKGITWGGYVESWAHLPIGAKHGSMKELTPTQYAEIKRAWAW